VVKGYQGSGAKKAKQIGTRVVDLAGAKEKKRDMRKVRPKGNDVNQEPVQKRAVRSEVEKGALAQKRQGIPKKGEKTGSSTPDRRPLKPKKGKPGSIDVGGPSQEKK